MTIQEQVLIQEPRKIDAHTLYTCLNQFQNVNANSSDVEHRWLAAYAGDLKTMAFHVKTGNHNTIKKQVNDFRLREIDEAKKKLSLEQDKLQVEEDKLLREIEQIERTASEAG